MSMHLGVDGFVTTSVKVIPRCLFEFLAGPYSKIIAAGLLLRFLLMPFTIQSDIVLHTWIANFVAQGHLDVYRYYFEQFGTVAFPPSGGAGSIAAAGFPPLFYLLYGAYLAGLQGLKVFSFLNGWAANLGGNLGVLSLMQFPTQNRAFFFLKAFYIPFDLLGLAAFLGCLDVKDRRAGACAWMFNPAILYIAYSWGQTDLIAASFGMLAVYLAKRAMGTTRLRDGLLCCVSLGLSASFKLYALALLPVFSLYLSKHSRRSPLYYAASGIFPLALIVPFISTPFLESMTGYSGFLLSRCFALPPHTQFTVYLVFALYLALIYHLFFVEVNYTFGRLLAYGLAIFSILYGLSIWLPNWILWGMPFILLIVLRRPKLFGVYLLITLSYFIFAQAWGNSLWIGLFNPLGDPWFGSGPAWNFPSLWDLLPGLFPVLTGLCYTAIGVSMFFLTYHAWAVCDSPETKPGGFRYSIVLAIPVSLGALTFVFARAQIQSYILSRIVGTFIAKVTNDPVFFTFYFGAIAVLCAWVFIGQLKGSWIQRRYRFVESQEKVS